MNDNLLRYDTLISLINLTEYMIKKYPQDNTLRESLIQLNDELEKLLIELNIDYTRG